MHRGRVRHLPVVRRLGPDDRDPDVLTSFDAEVVLRPIARGEATAVVRRENEGRSIAMGLERLDGIPEVLQELIGEMEIVQEPIVPSGMRPIVGLAEPEPHHPRAVLRQVSSSELEGEDVVAALLPELHDPLPQSAIRSISVVVNSGLTESWRRS
jgi:hypothetical protein